MKIICKKEVRDDKISDDEIVDLIIKNRQIKDQKEFLNPRNPFEISLEDLGFKGEFKKAIKILESIKKNGQTIVVYTDYDADGITGGAILWETLYLLNFKVMPYVPDRKKEGYGFSMKGIDNVKKEFDPALIISVDHGITKVKEVTYADKLGIDVIITDHHLKQKDIPKKSRAIFHIPGLSGSGVSYFFSKEIYQYFKRSDKTGKLETNFRGDYQALASIGTIADMVPLTGASRSLAKHGLTAITKTKRFGLRHILKEAGIENKAITPYEVGFIIAPRINAVGRLENAIDALRLLCTTREDRAFELAHKVGQKNTERQQLVKKAVEEAKSMVKKDTKIIILVSDRREGGWNEGIIGLIASKITEEFFRPTLVLTRNDGHYKASARSIPNFHITDFLISLKKYLVDVGGHKAAAGFTIEKEKLADFIEAAEKKAGRQITEADLEKRVEADLKIPLSKITLALAKKLERLQPFGIGNPQPVFFSEGEITGAQIFGKTNDHLKIFLKDRSKNYVLELIAFSQADLFEKFTKNELVNAIYTVDINRWGNSEKIRGIVRFISPNISS